jgi:subtilisin family serine protease
MNAEDRLKDMMSAARTEARASEREWSDFVRRAHRPLYARRAAAVIGSVALVSVGAFAAVALTRDSNDNRPVPPVASDAAPSPEPSPSPEETAPSRVDIETSEQEQWFVLNERLWWGTTIFGGHIPAGLADDDPVAQRAAFWIRSSLQPPGAVVEEGGASAIPEGTELLGITRDGPVLEVDLSSEFESGGGSLSMRLRVAQIVYMGTQFEGIDAVRILIEGQRVDAIGGEGLVVSEPLTRRDFQDVAPNIVVESPKPGDEFGSGSSVSGFANVFEANVNIRVRDADGKVIHETFTTATCGTGCWGDFAEKLKFDVHEEQDGRVEVLTFSAEDGSEQDMISIPVTLVP